MTFDFLRVTSYPFFYLRAKKSISYFYSTPKKIPRNMYTYEVLPSLSSFVSFATYSDLPAHREDTMHGLELYCHKQGNARKPGGRPGTDSRLEPSEHPDPAGTLI